MKNNMLLLCLALLLTGGFVLAACSQPAPSTPQQASAPQQEAPKEVIRWKGQHNFPTTVAPYGPYPAGLAGCASMALDWKKWIEEASHGRLIVDLAEPGAIFPAFEGVDAVKNRVVDIAFSYPGFFGGKIPEAFVEEGLPFAWQSNAEGEEGLFRYGIHDLIKEAYAEQGIYWMPYQTGAIVGIGTMFPAPNPESVRGKKIRAVGLWGDYVAMLGGSPVNAPWGDMYMGLKLGTFDGWMAGSGALEDQKLKEVTKGFVRHPMVNRAPNSVLINMESYKALPKDLQELIDRDSKHVLYRTSVNWERQCEWVLIDSAKKYGLQVYDWSAEDTARVTKMAVEQIWSKVAEKSPRTAKLVELVKKQMRDYGKLD